MKIETKFMLLFFVHLIVLLGHCEGMRKRKEVIDKGNSSKSNKDITPATKFADQQKPTQMLIGPSSSSSLFNAPLMLNEISHNNAAINEPQQMMGLNFQNVQHSIEQMELDLPFESNAPLQTEQIEALQAKKDFLCKIWDLVMTCFAFLHVQLAPIQSAKQGGVPLVNAAAEQLKLALQTMNHEKILTDIVTFLLPMELVKQSNLFIRCMTEINAEAKINGHKAHSGNNIITYERIFDVSDTVEIVKLKVIYFYQRLLRKLVGQLETPYNVQYWQKQNVGLNEEQSLRKIVVYWISKMLIIFNACYEDILKGLPKMIDTTKKISAPIEFENIESIKEFMLFTYFSISQTLSPFFEEQQNQHILNISSKNDLIKMIEQTNRNNIACVLLGKKLPDLEQIAMKSGYTTHNFGASAMFIKLLFDLAREHKKQHSEQSIYKCIHMAQFYLIFYQHLLTLANQIGQSPSIKYTSNIFKTEYEKLGKFLHESVTQLQALIDRWESETKNLMINITEAGFISDYLLEHCLEMISNDSAASEGKEGGSA